MSGDLLTKTLVVCAGLIATGACAGPLLFDPAVEEADEEDLVATDRTPVVDVDVAANTGPVVGDPVVGDPVVAADGTVVETGVVAGRVMDPDRTAVPFFVALPAMLVCLALTVWAVLTPAADLGRPCLIAGALVVLGTLLAWALWAAGVSPFPMTGTPLAAWLCVGFTLLAVWLVENVLGEQASDEAVAA